MTTGARGIGHTRAVGRFALLAPFVFAATLAAAPPQPPLLRAPASRGITLPDGDSIDLVYLAPTRPVFIRLHLHIDGESLSEHGRTVARRLFVGLSGKRTKPPSYNSASDNNLSPPSRSRSGAGAEGKGKEKSTSTPTLAPSARQNEKPWPLPTAAMLAVASVPSPAAEVPKRARATLRAPVDLAAFRHFAVSQMGPLVSLSIAPRSPNALSPQPVALNQPPANQFNLAALVRLLDADRDGRITAAEFERGNELFELLDQNEDEMLSPLELAAAADPRDAGDNNPLDELKERLFLIDRTTGNRHVVNSIVEKYGRGNNDFSDRDEVARMLLTPAPDFELDVKLMGRSLGEPSVGVRTAGAPSISGVSLKAGSPGPILQLQSLPIVLTAAETNVRAGSRTSSYRRRFKQASNGKGYVSAADLAAFGQSLGRVEFDVMDRDKNEMVTEAELLDFLMLRDLLAENRVSLTIAGGTIDPMAQFDENSDGRISRREFLSALATIKSWDLNHDGRIADDEVPRRFEGVFELGTRRETPRRRPAKRGNKMRDAFTDPKNAPAWFEKMDRNKDGEVSLREFLGPLSVFRKLDKNHDGSIDLQESAAASE